MTVYPQQANYPLKAPSPMDYDAASEKQRIAEATEEIKHELLGKWQKRYANAQIFPEKLLSVNPALLNFLLSYQNTLFYNDLARKFNLNQKQRDTLPQIIWQVCLNKQWEQLGALIQNNLSVGLPIAEQIATSLNQNIVLKARELSQQSFATSGFQAEPTENGVMPLTLNDALKHYPEIGEQLITSEHISLKNFPEPVRPSIKNWLADYTFTLGYEKHSSVERNNYIFHSDNSLHLSSIDRHKLAYILKAHDDGSPVAVNKNLKQIIFPAVSTEPRIAPVAPRETSIPTMRVAPNINQVTARPTRELDSETQPVQSAAIHQGTFFQKNIQPQTTNAPTHPAENTVKPAVTNNQKTSDANISFSSAQKLPYEKIYSSEPAPQQSAVNPRFNKIAPARPMPQQSAMETQPDEEKPHSFVIRPVFSHPEKKEDPKPLPRNVVNLKES